LRLICDDVSRSAGNVHLVTEGRGSETLVSARPLSKLRSSENRGVRPAEWLPASAEHCGRPAPENGAGPQPRFL